MTKWILVWVIYLGPDVHDPSPIAVSSGQSTYNSQSTCFEAGSLIRNNADMTLNGVHVWTRCFKK